MKKSQLRHIIKETIIQEAKYQRIKEEVTGNYEVCTDGDGYIGHEGCGLGGCPCPEGCICRKRAPRPGEIDKDFPGLSESYKTRILKELQEEKFAGECARIDDMGGNSSFK